jgi:PleD family two-component response regulator
VTTADNSVAQSLERPSILLASDSERPGNSLHRALRENDFEVRFAGDYSGLEPQLRGQKFDMILLEVTSEHAVEAAVQAALQIKRIDPSQFVGYLADASLDASGLAGDGVFPRSATRLPPALRTVMASDNPQAGNRRQD